jgi:hypothetical protein
MLDIVISQITMKTRLAYFPPFPSLCAILAFSLSSVALLALAPQTSAQAFTYSTGEPDGLAGTLSGVSSTTGIATETADDFVLTTQTIISQATFTGLLPSGASTSSITNVEVEIYRVFPNDSTNPPSGTVPTRDNSPADTAIAAATRDSGGGSLTFDAVLVNSSFAVANSVVNGINPVPNQLTGGEGPVTGAEVTITVTFNPPISLPADHYFFRPSVTLTSGDFLWLSAAAPVAPDLESWIRNDNLAPDWLRIGTDITGQGPLNASFSLTGDLDSDGDGVPDSVDQCPDTPAGGIINASGCTIDQLVPCEGPSSGGTWKNHGQYVSAIAHVSNTFKKDGLISGREKGQIVSTAARSDCGKNTQGSHGQDPGAHGHGHQPGPHGHGHH